MNQMNNLSLSEIRDVSVFAEQVLDVQLHDGQKFWLKNSHRLINILKPANQWGKTTIVAIYHIWQAVTKPALGRFPIDYETWLNTRYETLNFGKTYEVAKGVMELIEDITEGRYLKPDGKFNNSMLKGWAITKIDRPPKLPQILWYNGAISLIRSYDGLGESFKRKKLAYVSGDECGDIPELNLFVSGTLMPRVAFFQGSIHLVGTSQSKGVEYEDLSDTAEKSLEENPDGDQYFIISSNTNPEMASVYQNVYMPAEHLKRIEATADPELKKQIIYGQYVDWSKHLYTWDEINQMFTDKYPYNPETGFTEAPQKDGYYVFASDLAAAEDETSLTCLRYNIKKSSDDNGKVEYLPVRVVYHRAWKGKSFPLYLQYEMIKADYRKFKEVSPNRTHFIYDAGSLGGKNAGEAFRELNGLPFPPKGRSYAEIKAEGFGKVKEILSRNRKFVVGEKGELVDLVRDWGGIKASQSLKELRRQLEVASKDDVKLKNDQFSSFMMAVHYIEARAPKQVHVRAVPFNYNRLTNSR